MTRTFPSANTLVYFGCVGLVVGDGVVLCSHRVRRRRPHISETCSVSRLRIAISFAGCVRLRVHSRVLPLFASQFVYCVRILERRATLLPFSTHGECVCVCVWVCFELRDADLLTLARRDSIARARARFMRASVHAACTSFGVCVAGAAHRARVYMTG